MKTFFIHLLKNNGHLRGTLYFSVAFLTPVVAALQQWTERSPQNFYAISAVIVGAFLSGLVTLRAYLDQHLSRNPPDSVTNTEASSTSTTTTTTPSAPLT